MLSGWDIGTECNDQHVRRIGVAVDDFRYELLPGASNGTLYYTLRTKLSDKNGRPGMRELTQIDVLGINLLLPVALP